jgi:hypothetical protein
MLICYGYYSYYTVLFSCVGLVGAYVLKLLAHCNIRLQ